MQPVKRGASAPNNAFAHHGMDAVGADHDIGLDRAAVGKARHRAALAGLDAAAAFAEPDLARCEGLVQQVEQIGAVHGEIRRAELLAEVAAADARNVTSGPPRADELKFRGPADVFDAVVKAERAERLDRVGREIDPGPDLAENGRLLADDDLGAAPLQRQRRRQAADAAADDGDAWRPWHVCSSPILRHYRT